jgi:hypothetical protein
MAQTKTNLAKKSRSGGAARRAGSMSARSRSNSARSSGAKSSRSNSARSSGAKYANATRASKSSAPSGSRKNSSGRISGVARYLGDVTSKSMNGPVRAVASKAKDLGAVARKTKGAGAVGAAVLAGVAGLAGGIALDRWNNSYSRTQALARSRRGRSMRKAMHGARSGGSKIRR